MGQKAKVEGKGLEGRGRGSDKGPITVAMRVSGRSGSHPLRLESMSYATRISCHGNFSDLFGKLPAPEGARRKGGEFGFMRGRSSTG